MEGRLLEVLEERSPESIWRLSSELNALRVRLRMKRGKVSALLIETLDETLDVASDFHEFTTEMRSEIESRDFSQIASMFDLGSIGALAVQDVLPSTGGLSLPKMLLGALSEGLIFLGSRQYVAGAQRIVSARLAIHSHKVYRRLWELPLDFREQFEEGDVGELQESLDKFFAALLKDDVPPASRIAVLVQFYSLLLAVRTWKLVDAMR